VIGRVLALFVLPGPPRPVGLSMVAGEIRGRRMALFVARCLDREVACGLLIHQAERGG